MSKSTRNSVKPSVAGGGTKCGEVATASSADLAQDQANRTPSSDTTKVAPSEVPGVVAKELAKLFALIAEKSDSHDKKLEEIRNTTAATERRIADIVSRITEVEDRLCFLEDAREKQEANPTASSAEVEILRQKIDDMENRERRNNLRFLGFAESCEGSDMVAFLKATLPTLLNIDFPNGLEIERAHRLGPLSLGQGNQPSRPRPIIARFERYQDRERIAKAARERGDLIWRERRIMVFPDYSRLLSDKRRKFDECKKLLHEKRVRFFLNYPAVLTVITSRGRERFEDHKKALAYIRSME